MRLRYLHFRNMRIPVLLITLFCVTSLQMAAPTLGQAPDDRPTFSLPDNSLSFRYPKEWKVGQEGSHIKISADGVAFLLDHDSPASFPSGDPTLSADLRTRAESIATPLLSKPAYAGVKPLNLSGGSGAIFRFKGLSGSSDVVEVWFVQSSGHNITISPAAASSATHSLELTSLVRTLTFTGSAPVKSPSTGTGKAANARQKTRPVTPALSNATPPTAPATPSQPAERYEGRLIASDSSFVLRIYRGGTATAEWTRGNGNLLKYAGTYTGEDGNYSIKMESKPDSESSAIGPTHLSLLMKSIGGMVNAQYTLNTLPPHDAASLKLMEVDAGDVKLKGSKSGAAMGSGRRTGTSGRRRKR